LEETDASQSLPACESKRSPGIRLTTALVGSEPPTETDGLAAMSIRTMDYLVVPRMAALTLSMVALTAYFQAVAVAGGLAISSLYQATPFVEQLARFFEVITFADLAIAVAKSLCFARGVGA
jgi:phospholipid/cholesterol/gamma-HCH transport system permease protein